VKTGVQMVCNCLKRLDSGFRRNDGKRYFGTFYETVKITKKKKRIVKEVINAGKPWN
jgi:hypothetical protein